MDKVIPLPDRPYCQYTQFPCSTRQYADELETLLSIQQAITSRLNLNDVLKMIAEETHRLTSARLSLLYVLDGEDLQVAAIAGHDCPDDLIGYRIPVAQSVAGRSIEIKEPIIIPDVNHENVRIYREAISRYGNVRSYVAVPLISGTRPIGVIAVADQDPTVLGLDSLRVLSMLAPSAVIGLENARLYQEQQERRLEAEGRHQMAESLQILLAILNSNRSLKDILDFIVSHVSRRLLDCQATAIYALRPKDGKLIMQTSHGLPDYFSTITNYLPWYETVNQAVLTRKPVFVTDASSCMEDEIAMMLSPTEYMLIYQVLMLYQAWMAVPLIIKGEIYGAILFYYYHPHDFMQQEIGLALAFGDQVALAIENARLRIQAEQAAVNAERNRLARELHDSVSQTLFSTSLIAEVLPRLWDRNPVEGRQRLEELRQLTRGAQAEMRTLLFELRPSAIKEAKLGDLLKHLTQAVTGRTRIPITLMVSEEQKLPPEVQMAFYRIAQEALNNAIKYADPSQMQVSYTCNDDQVDLIICDNGCGFDPNTVSSEHLGIKIMHERAAAINATMKLNSIMGCGTQIEVSWSTPSLKEQS